MQLKVPQENLSEWKKREVTQAYFKQVAEYLAESQEQLMSYPGRDPIDDARVGGIIWALRELLNVESSEVAE